MSAEKIIEQIKKDSEKEIKKIQKEAETKAEEIINKAKKVAEEQSKKIEENGKKEAENNKKILISKAHQNASRKIMNAKEEVISKCFTDAKEKLSKIKEKEYQKIVETLMKKGSEKISGKTIVYISKESDKKIAEKLKLEVAGKIQSIGGIILSSKDSKVTIDNTFEGILKREQSDIRNKVGKMLFSE